MITELYIEGQKADISTTLASLLTFAIDDIKDFASRQTAFSKTVVLPGSQRNNKLFGSVFDVSIANDYDPSLDNVDINFNASVSANCILFQDFLQTFKGTIRILQINIDRGRIEYEAAITGELAKLNVALSSGLLEDLDFSAYDETYNETNIVASWNNPGGSGVYYPLIDYGTYSADKHNWDFHTFRPAMYVKEYIDKMFDAAGFRYSSNLFDTARFKSLIIPHNQKDLRSLTSRVIAAYKTTPQTIINTNLGDTFDPVDWDSFQAGSFTESGGEFTYNDPTTINTTLTWDLRGTRKATTAGTFTIHIQINGVDLASQTINVGPGGVPFPYTYLGSASTVLNQNDVLRIFYQYDGVGTGMVVTVDSPSTWFVDSDMPIFTPVAYDQLITMNDSIPKNIRQVDFLVSIIKLFNLYVYEDKFDERLLYIEPFVDFYSEESQNAFDWTYKLARDKPISIKPMSEINAKIYNFKYASDSDYYNELYEKRYNVPYGSFIFDTEFEFVDQTTDVELIFASTPLVGYGGEDKVYPTIFKLNNDIEETVDSVIRIMQTLKVTGVTSWDIKDGVTVLTSVTDYGYAGHFDDPDNVTNDLNFGAPEELFFILVSGDLTVTQFNVYWSSYMAEITDKDSKLLTGKFYLTPADILNLDFSKYVNVDGNLYRLNKITDYNLTKPDLCSIELLKVINTLY